MAEEQHKWRKYDVALSFAGEDRDYVEATAELLKARGVRVFYDRHEEADLWGKDLYVHLSDVYFNKAVFTIAFLSSHYARKLWTNHERKSAQARAFEENSEYLLPARFDDTPIQGISKTTGFVDLRHLTPEQFCDLFVEKLRLREQLIGPEPSHRLVSQAEARDIRGKRCVVEIWLDDIGQYVAIDHNAFPSFASLQDVLFLNYLDPFVSPYSYGSEWILVGGIRSQRILCPLEWVENAGGAIHQLDPGWSSSRLLGDLGMDKIFEWYVVPATRVAEKGVYGVMARTQEHAEYFYEHPKGISLTKILASADPWCKNWRDLKQDYPCHLVSGHRYGDSKGKILCADPATLAAMWRYRALKENSI